MKYFIYVDEAISLSARGLDKICTGMGLAGFCRKIL